MQAPKNILFLLGPASLLWRELGMAFEAQGHRVFKLHFSLGDQLFWWRRGGMAYRGRRSRFSGYLDDFIVKNNVTDILYYGDRDFYHVVAQDVAARRGIRAISVENGYLRPDWITLERGGMGAYSHFPDDPALVRALAQTLPEPDLVVRYHHGFAREITLEIAHAMASWWWRGLYPFYRFDRYYDPLLEYLLAIPHMLGRTRRQARAQAEAAALVSGEAPFFLVPLQLQGDQQIRANSSYRHLREFIEEVVGSFARHAPAGARLVFKQHPHDNGREAWEKVVKAAATRHGVASRTHFLDGGDLNALLVRAQGCVLVNSTVGLHALRAGCPTKVQGIAVYDMPGLTHQDTLDSFWSQPAPVDGTLAQALVKVLAATIQVKGSFVNSEGRAAAVGEIVKRVAGDRVNCPGALVDPPPRLARARALGLVI